MSSYWEDIECYEKRKHKRDMDWIKKKHDYKMEELDKEVKLHKLKEKKDK